MGLFFRRSKLLGPLRVSIGKRSASLKLGPVSVNTRGDVYGSASLGGGLYARERLGTLRQRRKRSKPDEEAVRARFESYRCDEHDRGLELTRQGNRMRVHAPCCREEAGRTFEMRFE